MSDQTVPTPTDIDEPQTKRADELKTGDWISRNEDETETGDTAEVLSAHTFEGRTLVVYTGSLGEPYTKTWPSARRVEIAGADEIAGMHEQRAKLAISDQLRSLSDLVLDLDAPMSIANGQVRITNEVQGIAEVAALSERLDMPVKVDTAGRNSVFWPRDRKVYDPGVLVEWYAYDPDFKKPEAEDPDHGRTTAVAEAKPDTLMVPHGEIHRTSAPNGGGE